MIPVSDRRPAFVTLTGRVPAQGRVGGLRVGAASQSELAGFLAEVEKKAFRIAQFALRHDEDALDAVQDAMLQLVRRYADRPRAEWRPLFYRVLENRIRDLQRRRLVRSRVMGWLPWSADEDGADADPVAQAPDPAPGPVAEVEGGEIAERLQEALRALPGRQRQAFLLRSLEGLDVAETAAACTTCPWSSSWDGPCTTRWQP